MDDLFEEKRASASLLNKLTEKKKKLDGFRPLPTELVKNLDDWLRVELTYSSNAIEGNTLTRVETAEVLEKGVSAVISGKALKDQLEAVNHAAAMKFIKELASERKSHNEITEKDIKNIHQIILTRIDDTWAGRYRESEVFIRGSNVDLPMPDKVPSLMQEFVSWLSSQIRIHPVRVAADAHYKFVSIHPFVDGNGRTARLLMNLILIINGYPMAVIRNEERTQYLSSLQIAQTTNNLEPFYHLMEISVERSLDIYLAGAEGKPALSAFKSLKHNDSKKLLKIGELAKESKETVPTIRHWTEVGVLEVAEYTKKGYQLYNRSMIERIREIRQLQKEEHLPLMEIKNRLRVET